jgi:hypothetical protein
LATGEFIGEMGVLQMRVGVDKAGEQDAVRKLQPKAIPFGHNVLRFADSDDEPIPNEQSAVADGRRRNGHDPTCPKEESLGLNDDWRQVTDQHVKTLPFVCFPFCRGW